MKTLSSILLSILFVSTAFAEQTVTGTAAVGLLDALTSIDSFVDCGMGKCGTSAADASCNFGGTRTAPIFTCDLKIESETGDQVAKHLTGNDATKLINGLAGAGVNSAKSIDCTFTNGTNPEEGGVECTLE